ncbi:MAG: hypothetical protein ACP5OV_01925 [Acidimicrobiales bacterium]
MGILDKVKGQAAAAASVARDAAQKGQSKVDEFQARRGADQTLRQLGLAFYLNQAGRGSATYEQDVAGMVESLAQYEGEHGPLTAD